MRTLIFAAGLGTRLKPLTDTMPKALVPVGGKPLLWHVVKKLESAGITDVVINVHHFADQIIDYVHGQDDFGIKVTFSDERDLLRETGGGIRHARKFLEGDSFLVHNVDILSNADLLSLYNNAHTTTLLVSQRQTQRYLLFDDTNRLIGWTNIATGEYKSPYSDIKERPARGLAFSGIQVFHPSLLPLMDSWEGKFSIIDFYLSICDKVDIRCCLDPQLQLLDVGKLDTIAKAEAFLQH